MKKIIDGTTFRWEKCFREKKNAVKYAKQRKKIRKTRVFKDGLGWSVYTKVGK